MNLQIENSISRIFDEAINRYQALLTGARQQTDKAAGRVVRSKKPVKTISRLSLKLTAVTHRTADKVLKQQTKMVENQIDAVAGRLRAAAESHNLRELVGTQIRLIPVNASQFVKDTRAALTIVAGAGSEVGGLVKNTVAELRGVPVAKAPKAPRKAKKAAAKTTTRKKAVKAKTQPVENTVADLHGTPVAKAPKAPRKTKKAAAKAATKKKAVKAKAQPVEEAAEKAAA